MAHDYKLELSFASRTGDPKDTVKMHWCVRYDGLAGTPGDPQWSPLMASTEALFLGPDVTPSGATLGMYLSPVLSRVAGDLHIRAYDITDHLDGSPHGSPVKEYLGQIAPSLNLPAIPNQSAIVLRFDAAFRDDQPVEAPDDADADAAPERPRQRYTNRTYFGPVNQGAVDQATTGAPYVSLAFRQHVGQAFQQYVAWLDAEDWIMTVWSEADENTRHTDRLVVDDSLDVIRRRKLRQVAVDKFEL